MTKINADSTIMVSDQIPAGSHWSLLMRRGTSLRLTDPDGGANVSMLMYNPHDKLERYNAPDTLKCQHTFKLTKGHCLFSDMGRIFCSITDDSLGWHDTVAGYLSDQQLETQYTRQNYQMARNDWTLSTEHCFMVELAKHGLGTRDLCANLNLFSKVFTNEAGAMQFAENHSQAGDHIELRFEMDTLVILATCPHPMNPVNEYPRKPIDYQIRKAPPVEDDDHCKNSCAENQRGFQNNTLYHLTGGY